MGRGSGGRPRGTAASTASAPTGPSTSPTAARSRWEHVGSIRRLAPWILHPFRPSNHPCPGPSPSPPPPPPLCVSVGESNHARRRRDGSVGRRGGERRGGVPSPHCDQRNPCRAPDPPIPTRRAQRPRAASRPCEWREGEGPCSGRALPHSRTLHMSLCV